MGRRELLAYLIGAAVAGTALVVPYAGRALANELWPSLLDVSVPFFLLPIVWGVWNWLHARLEPRVAIGGWGAILGFALALGVDLLLYGQGRWFGFLALLPAYLPVVYYLAWYFIVGPLNDALGVSSSRSGAESP